MRRPLRTASFAAVAIAIALIAAAGAYAVTFQINSIAVSATAGVMPRTLPTDGETPVKLSSVTRVTSKDGLQPPALQELTFLFDKNGTINTKGLPVCTEQKLADTTPAAARKRCAGAIVGEGTAKAEVRLPGAAPIPISSPLTIFNAPPESGRPTLIAHAYETVPSAKTLLVPFSIERVSQGRYGYRAKIQMPPISGGFGAATLAEATVGTTWTRGGKTVGYVSAHCNGGRLQVYGTARFVSGAFFPAVLTSPCHAPR